jgi:hypothetical protein
MQKDKSFSKRIFDLIKNQELSTLVSIGGIISLLFVNLVIVMPLRIIKRNDHSFVLKTVLQK